MKNIFIFVLLIAIDSQSKNRSVEEDLALCQQNLISIIENVEVAGESKFSDIRVDIRTAQIEDSEMPDMTGDRRRRRRGYEKVPPSQMGRKLTILGVVKEAKGYRKVVGRCMIYKGKGFTTTYELESLQVNEPIIFNEVSTTTTTTIQSSEESSTTTLNPKD